MEYKEMRKQLMATMKEFGYKYNKIAVELCGKVTYITETELRALQVMVMGFANLIAFLMGNGVRLRQQHFYPILAL